MPLEYFPTEKDLLTALNAWADDESRDGGAFKILTGSSGTRPLKSKGTRRLLRCDRSGTRKPRSATIRLRQRTSKKCACKWAIWIEESCDGRVVAEPSVAALKELNDKGVPNGESFHLVHNHDLYQNTLEKNTNHAMRYLAQWQQETAELLANAGLSIPNIFSFLSSKCKERNEEIRFSQDDLYNQFGRGSQTKTAQMYYGICMLVTHQMRRSRLNFI